MLGELYNYFSKDSYTRKDEEIQKAFDLYEEGLLKDTPEGETRREEGREDHRITACGSRPGRRGGGFF